MHNVEHKLTSWHKLYKTLQSARDRLSAVRGEEHLSLAAEVQRLQRDSDRALAEVQALLAHRHVTRNLNASVRRG